MIDFEAVLKNGLMVKIDYVTAKKLAVEMQKLEIEITIENLKKMDTAALEKWHVIDFDEDDQDQRKRRGLPSLSGLELESHSKAMVRSYDYETVWNAFPFADSLFFS